MQADHKLQPISQVGKTIADKYQLTRIIGMGGMGSVYEALHTVTLRRVAVKLIHGWVLENAAAGQRFLREAQAPAQIGHPAIVDVLDAGQLPDNTYYLVFDLLEGEDLEATLARGPADPAEIVPIIIELLDALSAAHASGFVHRDIKPANIFVCSGRPKHRVKLLDFGIAKRNERTVPTSVTMQGSVVGTLDYMSPEQAYGGTVDARADIWAVGAMLFRAFAGRLPFEGKSTYELLEQVVTGRAPSLGELREDLPEDLIAVVDRALQRDLEDRWLTASRMRDALMACEVASAAGPGARDRSALRDEPITPPDTPPEERPDPATDERPALQLGALGDLDARDGGRTDVEPVPDLQKTTVDVDAVSEEEMTPDLDPVREPIPFDREATPVDLDSVSQLPFPRRVSSPWPAGAREVLPRAHRADTREDPPFARRADTREDPALVLPADTRELSPPILPRVVSVVRDPPRSWWRAPVWLVLLIATLILLAFAAGLAFSLHPAP